MRSILKVILASLLLAVSGTPAIVAQRHQGARQEQSATRGSARNNTPNRGVEKSSSHKNTPSNNNHVKNNATARPNNQHSTGLNRPLHTDMTKPANHNSVGQTARPNRPAGQRPGGNSGSEGSKPGNNSTNVGNRPGNNSGNRPGQNHGNPNHGNHDGNRPGHNPGHNPGTPPSHNWNRPGNNHGHHPGETPDSGQAIRIPAQAMGSDPAELPGLLRSSLPVVPVVRLPWHLGTVLLLPLLGVPIRLPQDSPLYSVLRLVRLSDFRLTISITGATRSTDTMKIRSTSAMLTN